MNFGENMTISKAIEVVKKYDFDEIAEIDVFLDLLEGNELKNYIKRKTNKYIRR